MRTARPLVPRSLLTALVSSGVATDTSNLTDAELDELSRHHRVLAVCASAYGVAGKLAVSQVAGVGGNSGRDKRGQQGAGN